MSGPTLLGFHPDVDSVRMTCPTAPEQYVGRLKSGTHFYFRYRHVASVWLSGNDDFDSLDHVGKDMCSGGWEVNTETGLFFDTQEQRDGVFAALLAKALESPVPIRMFREPISGRLEY